MNEYKLQSSILCIPYLITKTEAVQKLAGAKFMKSHNLDISIEQFDVLHILYQQDGISQNELGRIAIKDKANVARIIAVLEEKKLVSRKLGTINNRAVKKVFITKAGNDFINVNLPVMIDEYSQMLKGVSDEEIEFFKSILEKLKLNVQDYVDK